MAASENTNGHGDCGGKTRKGTPCERPKGWGTPHPGIGSCKFHGGSTATHVKAAEREMAKRACVSLGIPVEIHPAEALVREVFRAQGNVDFYESLVAELPTHPEPDEYVAGEPGAAEGHWVRGDPGVYGRTYHVSGLPTGEAKPHVLVTLYNEERGRLVAATTAALKAGVDARRVEIAQEQARLIAEGFRALAQALGHDPSSQKVREACRAQLTVIAGGLAA